MDDLGHWKTKLKIPEKLPFGFVYKITNKINGKMYIGKKQCIRELRLPPLKGKVRRRLVKKESDWKTYMSSGNKLLDDINSLGKENFDFEILAWGNSKSHISYLEAKLQFDEDVLLSENYYNGIINIRLSKIKTGE